MTIVVKLRLVMVGDQAYEVPTNVCWQQVKQRWIVSVRSGGKSNFWFFHVADHGGRVDRAFEAAVAEANLRRVNPSVEVVRESERRLLDFPPLPVGIIVRQRLVKGQLQAYLLVYVTKRLSKRISLGLVETLTASHYDQVLAHAQAIRQAFVTQHEEASANKRTQALAEIDQRLAHLKATKEARA